MPVCKLYKNGTIHNLVHSLLYQAGLAWLCRGNKHHLDLIDLILQTYYIYVESWLQLCYGIQAERAIPTWNITSLVAEGKKKMVGHEQALQTLAQKRHLAVLLTFYWPKKVACPSLRSMGLQIQSSSRLGPQRE